MIHKQNVFDRWRIPDKSVQAIITSPPYWKARLYNIPDIIIEGCIANDGCRHHWEHYVAYQEPMKINKRAAKITGYKTEMKYCVNCGAFKGQYGQEKTWEEYIKHTLMWCDEAWRVLKDDGIFFLNIGDKWGDNKNKLLIPHRIAIELCNRGWILRNDIVWVKTLAMPESVRDRFSKCWEPVFFFTKKEDYYFDMESMQTSIKDASLKRMKYSFTSSKSDECPTYMSNKAHIAYKERFQKGDIKGVNPKDVWILGVNNTSIKHYATYPEELPRKMITCSSKEGNVVLDPFSGSGTTVRIAKIMGRRGVGFDLGYHGISRKNTQMMIQSFFKRS